MLSIQFSDRPSGLIVQGVRDGMNDATSGFLLGATAIVQEAIIDSISATRFRRPSGALMSSFEPSLVQLGEGQFTAGVFSDLVYARIQDVGGPIRASGGWLTIPLKRFARGVRARDQRLVAATSRAGKLFLVKEQAGRKAALSSKATKATRTTGGSRGGRRGGRPVLATDELMWLLVKEVRITGKLYLQRAYEAAEPRVAEFAEEYWAGVMAGGGARGGA